jgi:hypothetical protein
MAPKGLTATLFHQCPDILHIASLNKEEWATKLTKYARIAARQNEQCSIRGGKLDMICLMSEADLQVSWAMLQVDEEDSSIYLRAAIIGEPATRGDHGGIQRRPAAVKELQGISIYQRSSYLCTSHA